MNELYIEAKICEFVSAKDFYGGVYPSHILAVFSSHHSQQVIRTIVQMYMDFRLSIVMHKLRLGDGVKNFSRHREWTQDNKRFTEWLYRQLSLDLAFALRAGKVIVNDGGYGWRE